LEHRWSVLGLWVAALLIASPTALLYTHTITYTQSTSGVSGSQSQKVQELLASVHPENSTLYVVLDHPALSPAGLCRALEAFQGELARANVTDLAGSTSVCSLYAGYLDSLLVPERAVINSTAGSVRAEAKAIYAFPEAFLTNWTEAGTTYASINLTFQRSGGSPSGYPEAFVRALSQNYSRGLSGAEQVQQAVMATAGSFFPAGPELRAILTLTNVTAFVNATSTLTADLLAPSVGPWITPALVNASLSAGDPGWNAVNALGWTGAPPYLSASLVSPDHSVLLVVVTFNVSEGYRGPNNFYPAQAATPTLRGLAAEFFGPAAGVAGSGALAYDTQSSEGATGAFFAFLFVFLAVAVALTLRSWVAPLLALLFASLGTLLGYLAIFLTGTFVGPVNYVVTYTLMAVTLGIATDYLVFLLYRYREELGRGTSPQEALRVATERSVPTILTSSLIVAVALGSLSFIPGLFTWGPVLFLAVIFIGLMMATLLPAVAGLVGPRLFVRRYLRPPKPFEQSRFYRAARFSSRRPLVVLAVLALVAVPSVAFWFVAPVSYNFNEGLPHSFPSVRAQDEIDTAFGANELYPTFVLVPSPSGFLAPNGTVTPQGATLLRSAAEQLLSYPTVASGVGPFLQGRNLTGASGGDAFLLQDGHWAYFTLFLTVGPFSPQALALVHQLRDQPGWLVGGVSASVVDQEAQNAQTYPILEVLIAVLIGLIVGLAFRSWAYPLIALSGVFISITVTTALLYLISTYLLHVGLLYLIPLILFVILVALGNDYTIFIFSRIREERTVDPSGEWVARGISRSGVVVTSLGLILAASLGSLAFQPISFLQQLGIAFALSLVLDTFVIRIFYFPAMIRRISRA
jgi:RND superfamily putative drug exporter